MAITFVGGDPGGTQGSTAVDLAWPATDADDVAIIVWAFSNTATPTPDPPTGWTTIYSGDAGLGSGRWRLLRKVCTGSESGNETLTVDNSQRQAAALAVYRGVDPDNPIDGFSTFNETGASTTHDAPSYTITVADCGIVTAIAERASTITTNWTPPTSFNSNEVDSTTLGTGAGGVIVALADDGLATARAASTAVDPGVWSSNSGTGEDTVTVWTLALRPLSTATPEVAYPRPRVAPVPRLIRAGVSQPLQLMGDRTSPSGATEVSLSDTAAGVDALTVSATVPLADTASAAEALTVSATVALADTATAVDDLVVSVPVTLADTATAVDSLSVTATVPLTDTGAGTDSLAVTATVPLADTATGTDVLAVQALGQADPNQAGPQIAWMFTRPNAASLQLRGSTQTVFSTTPSLPDTATAVDNLVATATVPLTDTGTGTDTLSAAAAIPLADTAVATDATSITATVPLADSTTCVDALSVSSENNPSLPDTATAADSLTITVTLTLADTASGADTMSAARILSLTETATATDLLAITVGVPLADTGAATDTLSVVVPVTLADTATAVDAMSAANQVISDGNITGGRRTAPDVTGGLRTTVDITGGRRQEPALVGGARI